MRRRWRWCSHLWLEAHVEHAVRLIEHKVDHLAQLDDLTLDKVVQTARRRDDDVHAEGQGLGLRALVRAAIDGDWTKRRAIGQLLRLQLNLRRQLAGGCHDDCARLSRAGLADCRAAARGGIGERGADGHEEGSSLAASSLGAAHQIAAGERERHGVLLDGGRLDVVHQADVSRQKGRQTPQRAKLVECRRSVGARPAHLHLDFSILVELDALRALRGEQGLLAGVGLLANQSGLDLEALSALESCRLGLLEVVVLGL